MAKLLSLIIETFKMQLFNGYCKSARRLDGKTVVITGSNSGIGKVAVKDFYKRGARVIMACRNLDRANEAISDIKKDCTGDKDLGEIIATILDLTSLASVRKCAQHLLKTEKRIDILVNNAGVMCCPPSVTEDGFETQFGVNHLGHFLFTLLLLPKLAKSTPARVVTIASLAHAFATLNLDDLNFEKHPYSSMGAYEQSKLCNILFTSELAKRLKDAGITGINTYSLHPGLVATELGRHLDTTYVFGVNWIWSFLGWLLKTQEQGAQTTIYCAVDEKVANETGLYYADCALISPSKDGINNENAKKLWDISLKYVGMENVDPFADIKTK